MHMYTLYRLWRSGICSLFICAWNPHSTERLSCKCYLVSYKQSWLSNDFYHMSRDTCNHSVAYIPMSTWAWVHNAPRSCTWLIVRRCLRFSHIHQRKVAFHDSHASTYISFLVKCLPLSHASNDKAASIFFPTSHWWNIIHVGCPLRALCHSFRLWILSSDLFIPPISRHILCHGQDELVANVSLLVCVCRVTYMQGLPLSCSQARRFKSKFTIIPHRFTFIASKSELSATRVRAWEDVPSRL